MSLLNKIKTKVPSMKTAFWIVGLSAATFYVIPKVTPIVKAGVDAAKKKLSK